MRAPFLVALTPREPRGAAVSPSSDYKCAPIRFLKHACRNGEIIDYSILLVLCFLQNPPWSRQGGVLAHAAEPGLQILLPSLPRRLGSELLRATGSQHIGHTHTHTHSEGSFNKCNRTQAPMHAHARKRKYEHAQRRAHAHSRTCTCARVRTCALARCKWAHSRTPSAQIHMLTQA